MTKEPEFIISGEQLQDIRHFFSMPEHSMDDADYMMEDELLEKIRSRPLEQEKQAAINGVLDKILKWVNDNEFFRGNESPQGLVDSGKLGDELERLRHQAEEPQQRGRGE